MTESDGAIRGPVVIILLAYDVYADFFDDDLDAVAGALNRSVPFCVQHVFTGRK